MTERTRAANQEPLEEETDDEDDEEEEEDDDEGRVVLKTTSPTSATAPRKPTILVVVPRCVGGMVGIIAGFQTNEDPGVLVVKPNRQMATNLFIIFGGCALEVYQIMNGCPVDGKNYDGVAVASLSAVPTTGSEAEARSAVSFARVS